MSKHTPGPWGVERDGSWAYIIGDHGLIKIADVCEDRTVIPPATAKANARLIAAAPKLLEVLEMIVGRLNFQSKETDCAKALIARIKEE